MENENSNEQKILGLVIDNKLKFESHINESCKKASQKKVIFNSIIEAKFNYCPLV